MVSGTITAPYAVHSLISVEIPAVFENFMVVINDSCRDCSRTRHVSLQVLILLLSISVGPFIVDPEEDEVLQYGDDGLRYMCTQEGRQTSTDKSGTVTVAETYCRIDTHAPGLHVAVHEVSILARVFRGISEERHFY
jgi:hypothetical protein